MLKFFARVIVMVAVALLALRIADRAARRADPLPDVPQPNGYDALLGAARKVTVPSADLADLNADMIRQLAETNRPWVDELEGALKVNTGVPLKLGRGWADQHDEDVKKLKRFAVALSIQSRSELLKGNTNRSASFLLDMILLGQSMARGGIVSDATSAMLVETIGTASLRAQTPHLDADFCRQAAQALERSEALRESPERIVKTQADWAAANFGLISWIGDRTLLRKSGAQRRAEFLSRYQEITRRTRRLMLILAARAVELQTGKRVADPAELVPVVLKSVPLEPEKNTPMKEIPAGVNDP